MMMAVQHVFLFVFGLSSVLSDSRQLHHPSSLQHQYLHRHQHQRTPHQYYNKPKYPIRPQPRQYSLPNYQRYPPSQVRQSQSTRNQRFLPHQYDHIAKSKHPHRVNNQNVHPRIIHGKSYNINNQKTPRKIANTQQKVSAKDHPSIHQAKKTKVSTKEKNDNALKKGNVVVLESKLKPNQNHVTVNKLKLENKIKPHSTKTLRKTIPVEKKKQLKADYLKKLNKYKSTINRNYVSGPPAPKFIIKQAGPSQQFGWVGHGTYAPLNIPNIFKAAGLNTKWIPEDNQIFEAGLTYPVPAQDKIIVESINPRRPAHSVVNLSQSKVKTTAPKSVISNVAPATLPSYQTQLYQSLPETNIQSNRPKKSIAKTVKYKSTSSPIVKELIHLNSLPSDTFSIKYKDESVSSPNYKATEEPALPPTYEDKKEPTAQQKYESLGDLAIQSKYNDIEKPANPQKYKTTEEIFTLPNNQVNEKPATPPKYEVSPHENNVKSTNFSKLPQFETTESKPIYSTSPAPVYSPPSSNKPSTSSKSPSQIFKSFTFFKTPPTSGVESYGSDTIDLYTSQVSTSDSDSNTSEARIVSTATTDVPIYTTTIKTTTNKKQQTQHNISTRSPSLPPIIFSSPTPKAYSYQPVPTYHTSPRPSYNPAPSIYTTPTSSNSNHYNSGVSGRPFKTFINGDSEIDKISVEHASPKDISSSSPVVGIIEVQNDNKNQLDDVDDEEVFYIFYENEDSHKNDDPSDFDLQQLIQEEYDDQHIDSVFSASVPEGEIFVEENDVPVFEISEKLNEQHNRKISNPPPFYNIPIKIEESGEGFDPPTDIRTIFVPIENAINVPDSFDINVGTSFGYSSNNQQQQLVPTFTKGTVSSYDNPISSFDAPIAPIGQGTSIKVFPNDEVFLGKESKNKSLRRVRKLKTEKTKQKFKSVPFGAKLETNSASDPLVKS